PLETREAVDRLLDEAATFRRFGDAGSALMLYREAYALHPRNRRIVDPLEALLADVAERALTSGVRADLERVADNLAAVMETDDFLGNRPTLVKARQRVRDALAR